MKSPKREPGSQSPSKNGLCDPGRVSLEQAAHFAAPLLLLGEDGFRSALQILVGLRREQYDRIANMANTNNKGAWSEDLALLAVADPEIRNCIPEAMKSHALSCAKANWISDGPEGFIGRALDDADAAVRPPGRRYACSRKDASSPG